MKWILEGEDGRAGEDCGTRRCWVVPVGRGAAEVPRPELERIFGIPTPLVEKGPASHAPSPNQSGDFYGPSCWLFEESESERGKKTEEIAAP